MLAASPEALRLPPELRRSLQSFAAKRDVLKAMRKGRLSTVCEEARCPNIGECFSNKTATFMIMGDICTRRCQFCSVKTGRPQKLDFHEPEALAQAALDLGLEHVVVTSVDRDELPDHGANHFVAVVQALKRRLPQAIVELLVPDFRGKPPLVDLVINSGAEVFGHNIESVGRLYKKLRPQSNFETSKSVLKRATQKSGLVVKSGLMVGVGETDEEVLETLSALRDIGVQIVTIGQYLRPTLKSWRVHRYVSSESYARFVNFGLSLGLKHVFAGPFVRSSYHAKEALQAASIG